MPAARRTSDTSKLGHFSITLPTLSADGYLEFPGQHSLFVIQYVSQNINMNVLGLNQQTIALLSRNLAKFCSAMCNYLKD